MISLISSFRCSKAIRPPKSKQIASWSKKLVRDCRKQLVGLLPLRSHEIEFLTRLNDYGEIAPELLIDDAGKKSIIAAHPALRWKAQNVRVFKKG